MAIEPLARARTEQLTLVIRSPSSRRDRGIFSEKEKRGRFLYFFIHLVSTYSSYAMMNMDDSGIEELGGWSPCHETLQSFWAEGTSGGDKKMGEWRSKGNTPVNTTLGKKRPSSDLDDFHYDEVYFSVIQCILSDLYFTKFQSFTAVFHCCNGA